MSQQQHLLVRVAVNAQESLDARVQALQALAQLVPSSQGQIFAAAASVPAVWPQLQQLLWTPGASSLQTAAAEAVGALGAALAALAPAAGSGTPTAAPSQPPPSFLFDWAVHMLTTGAAGPDVKVLVLSAMHHCLLHLPPHALATYAERVLTTCQGLLEGDDTDPLLLSPMLPVIRCAACYEPALAAHFHDLVELLLGWSLSEPSLTHAIRADIGDTIQSFGPMWQKHLPYAKEMVAKILQDLDVLLAADLDAPPSTEQQVQFAALSLCGTSIMLGSGQRAAAAFLTDLPRLHSLLGRALRRFHPPATFPAVPPPSGVNAVDTICHVLQALLAGFGKLVDDPGFEPTPALLSLIQQDLPLLMGVVPVVDDHVPSSAEETGAPAADTTEPQDKDGDRGQLRYVQEVTAAAFRNVLTAYDPGGVQLPAAGLKAAAATAEDGNSTAVMAAAGQVHAPAQPDSSGPSIGEVADEGQQEGSRVGLTTAKTHLVLSWLGMQMLAFVKEAIQQPALGSEAIMKLLMLEADVLPLLGRHADETVAAAVVAACWQKDSHLQRLRCGCNPALVAAVARVHRAMLRHDGPLASRSCDRLLGALRRCAGPLLPSQPPEHLNSINLRPGMVPSSDGAYGLVREGIENVEPAVAVLSTAPNSSSTADDGGNDVDAAAAIAEASFYIAMLQAAVGDLAPGLHKPLVRCLEQLLHQLVPEGCATALCCAMLEVLSSLLQAPSPSDERNQQVDGDHITRMKAADAAPQRLTDATAQHAQHTRACAVMASLMDRHPQPEVASQIITWASRLVMGPGFVAADATAVEHAVRVLMAGGSCEVAGLRQASVAAGEALARSVGSAFQPHVWQQLLTMACDRAADVVPAVAASAEKLLLTLLEPATALAAGGLCEELFVPGWREQLATQPQSRTFRPAQLAKLFEHLFQPAAPGLLLKRKQEASAPLTEPPLYQLALSLPSLPPPQTPPVPAAGNPSSVQARSAAGSQPDMAQDASGATRGRTAQDGPGAATGAAALDVEQLHSSSALAWFLVQEAARHCVAARMRTHLGGPTQSFGALEKLLQSTLGKLLAESGEEGGTEPAPAAGTEETWLMLEFMQAFERGMHVAVEGTASTPNPTRPVMAFFAANRRVCEEWFSRVRELLLRIASAAGLPHHVVYHAQFRLSDLRLQLRGLMQQQLRQQEQAQAAAAAASQADKDQRAASTVPASQAAPPRVLRSRRPPANGTDAAAEAPAEAPPPENAPASAGSQLAAALAKLGRNVLEVLKLCSLALCQLGEPEAVSGLAAYSATAFQGLLRQNQDPAEAEDVVRASVPDVAGGTFAWLLGVASQAAGRYEVAIQQYSRYLQCPPSRQPLGQAAAPFVVARMSECYASLGNWHGLKSLMEGDNGAARRLLATPLHTHGLSQQQLHSYFAYADLDLRSPLFGEQQAPVPAHAGIIAAIRALQDGKQQAVAASTLEGVLSASREQLRVVLSCQSPAAALPTLAQLLCSQQLHASLTSQHTKHAAAATLQWQDMLPRLHPYLCHLSSWDHDTKEARRRPNEWTQSASAWLLHGGRLRAGAARDVAPLLQLLRAAREADPLMAGPRTCCLLLHATQAAAEAGNLRLASGLLQLGVTQVHDDGQARQLLTATQCLVDAKRVTQGEHTEGLTSASVTQRLIEALLPALGQPSEPSPDAISARCLLALGVRLQELPHNLLQLPEGSRAAAADWESVAMSSLPQVLQQLGGSHEVDEVIAAAGNRKPQLATLSAALAKDGSLPDAWKVFADYAFGLAQEQRAAAKKERPGVELGTEDLAGYSLAIRAYTKFLALASRSSCAPPDEIIAVLLRVLRVAVRHGEPLVADLEAGAADCPAAAWQPITPQLFAHLAHPQPAVRRVVLALLQRVALAAPAAVLYPALVEVRLADAAGETPQLEIKALLEALDSRQPGLVSAARAFSEELERVTVLPEERWHALLVELELDVQRRLVGLQAQAAQLADNKALSREQRHAALLNRYTTLMAPVTLMLERQLRTTSAAGASTPHERAFHANILPRLRSAIAAFKAPQNLGSAPPRSHWEPLRAVAMMLAGQLRQPRLQLTALSPWLATLNASAIPMPGMAGSHALLAPSAASGPERWDEAGEGRGQLTISSVQSAVLVLATKTRPKRLVLLGGDGRSYAYLLKGRDDLRMDERLMQVLAVINSMLAADPEAARQGLRARGYSVTPVGDRVGLIEWVDNTTSIFSLFKAWQANSRERHDATVAARQDAARAAAAAEQQQAAAQGERGRPTALPAQAPEATVPPLPAVVTISRPADLFYSRLMPALREAGITGVPPRREWPLPLLRGVLLGLLRESPRQLLSKEVWAGSSHTGGWWLRHRHFSRTTAVMSMVGHILGLGDRHLDNILLDLASAEVLHIDFNVCFDKGLRLRVPEIVPFRLTQAMQAALGLTGVEGVFRSACEATMAALRSRREPMAALLDAVLADPLVEWAAERDDLAARKNLELAVTLNLAASRAEELAARLEGALGGDGGVLGVLPSATAALCGYVDVHVYLGALAAAMVAAQQRAAEAQAVIATSTAAEAEAAQNLTTANQTRQSLLLELQAPTASLHQLHRECIAWDERHRQTVEALKGGAAQQLLAAVGSWRARDAGTPLGLVTAMGADQTDEGIVRSALGPAARPPYVAEALLAQCAALDAQGAQLLGHRDALVERGASALAQYTRAMRLLLPANYSDFSHHHVWAEALGPLMTTPGPEACHRALAAAPRSLTPQDAAGDWAALQRSFQAGARQSEALQLLDPQSLLGPGWPVAGPAEPPLPDNPAAAKAAVLSALQQVPAEDRTAAAAKALSGLLDAIAAVVSAASSLDAVDAGTRPAVAAAAAATGCSANGIAADHTSVVEAHTRAISHASSAENPVAGQAAADDAQARGGSTQEQARGGELARGEAAETRSGGSGTTKQEKEDAAAARKLPVERLLAMLQGFEESAATLQLYVVLKDRANPKTDLPAITRQLQDIADIMLTMRHQLLPDLLGHTVGGPSPCLAAAATLAAEGWAAVQQLLQAGKATEQRMADHKAVLAACRAERADLEARAAELRAAPGGRAPDAQLQDITSRLQALDATWSSRMEVGAPLLQEAQRFRTALASAVRGAASSLNGMPLADDALLVPPMEHPAVSPAREPGATGPQLLAVPLWQAVNRLGYATAPQEAAAVSVPLGMQAWGVAVFAIQAADAVLQSCVRGASLGLSSQDASARISDCLFDLAAQRMAASQLPALLLCLKGIHGRLQQVITSGVLPDMPLEGLAEGLMEGDGNGITSDRGWGGASGAGNAGRAAYGGGVREKPEEGVYSELDIHGGLGRENKHEDAAQLIEHELVPFVAFDFELEGAGALLEEEGLEGDAEGGLGGLEASDDEEIYSLGGGSDDEDIFDMLAGDDMGGGAHDEWQEGMGEGEHLIDVGLPDDLVDLGQAAPGTAGDLVPFVAFDFSLPGADEILENDLEPGPEADAQLEPEHDAGSQADVRQEKLELDPATGSGSTAEGASSQRVEGGGQEELCSLVLRSWPVLGRGAFGDWLEGRTEGLLPACRVQQDHRLRQLAAFEWMHAAKLQQVQLPVEAGLQPPLASLRLYFQLLAASGEVEGDGDAPTPDVAFRDLQSAVEALSAADQRVAAWEQQSAAAAAAVHAAVAAAAQRMRLPVDANISLKMMQGQLNHRAQWLAGARERAAAVWRLCEVLLQLEASRDGKLWSQGQPVEAFASCAALLQQVTALHASLAAATASSLQAQQRIALLRSHIAEAQYTLKACGEDEAGVLGALEAQAPLLVLRGGELGPAAEELMESLRPHMGLLCTDLGGLLRELHSTAQRQAAARDIALMAGVTLERHGHVAALLERLVQLLGQMRGALAAAEQLAPMPSAAELAGDGVAAMAAETAAVMRRGQALLEVLDGAVMEVQPLLPALIQAGAGLDALLMDLQSLSAACSSVAAAIQSEHGMEDEAEAAAPGGQPEAPTPREAASESQTHAQDKAALLSSSRTQTTLSGPEVEDSRSNAPTPAAAEGTASGMQGAGVGDGSSATPLSAPQTLAVDDGVAGMSGEAGAVLAAAAAGESLSPYPVTLLTGEGPVRDEQEPSADRSVGAVTQPAARHRRQGVAAAAGDVMPPTAVPGQGGRGASVGRPRQRPGRVAGSEERRRAFTTTALRRCMAKLEGRVDGERGPVVSVTQQVTNLIEQATSLDNLSRMFEGWTPWL